MVEDCGSSNNGTVILYIITTATIDCLQYASNQKTGVGNAQYMRLVLTMRVVVVSSSANNGSSQDCSRSIEGTTVLYAVIMIPVCYCHSNGKLKLDSSGIRLHVGYL